MSNFGATPQDWQHFGLTLGLTADLLPVVSNPMATISPDSALKDLGKTPSRYNNSRHAAGIAQWTQRVSTPEDIAKWAREPDYGICLQTRHVRAIDVDVTDELGAEIIASFIDSLHPSMPKRTRSNSSKFLLAFRLEGEFTKRKFKTQRGIVEFLATGQQFVALGQHPSGSRYEWFDGLPDDFPALSKDQFEALWAALVEKFATEEASEASASVKQQKLAEAHSADPVASHLIDKNLVRKVGGDGRMHIICPWEADHTTDSSESATTYWPAHTGGYVNGHFLCMHAHCEHRTDAEFKEAIGYVDDESLNDFAVLNPENNQPETLKGTEQIESKVSNRFAVVPAHEFAVSQRTPWLIKGILPKAEMGVLFGDSGSGKTFKVLDMGAAIARGVEWRGHKVTQGRVAYIAAEGAGGFRKRLQAYAHHHGIALSDLPIGVIPSAPNLLQKADALDVAKAVLAWGGADLIIIDTLAQTTPGGNENSGEDVGKALAHCKGIHKATGALVLLVHHSGKDTTRGARGWSGLRAAADVEMEVTRFENDRVLSLTKQKDGEDGVEFGFRLHQILLGEDEDGEEITSCVVEHTSAVDKSQRASKKEPKGNIEKMLLRLFKDTMDLADGTVKETELIEAAVDQMPVGEGKRDRRRERVMRAMESLLSSGALSKNKNVINLGE